MRDSMIIKSLFMKNFKSHQDTKIEFNTGISIIMGGNGAGKSSILEAVSFALFKQHSGKKIEQLITIGDPKAHKKMIVELEFSSNGRTYRVLRERSKNSSKAKIEILDGGKFQSLSIGDKQVTEEVQNILEMDGDLFLNAVYVRQGEIANLVDKTPAEKKQVIGKLLGIESLEKAWKNMLPLMNQYEMQKEKLEGKLEALSGLNKEIIAKKTEKSIIHHKIQEISLSVKKIEDKLIVASRKMDSLNEDRSAFDKALNSIESKKQLLEKLQRENNHITTQISEIGIKEEEIDIIRPKISKLEVLKRLKESRDNLKSVQTNKQHIIDILDKIKESKSFLSENKNSYESYSNLSDEISDLEIKRSEFEGSRALMKQSIDRKEQTLRKMNSAHDKLVKVIKEYNSSLGTEFSLVEELETYLKSIKPEISDKIVILTDRINKIEQKLSNLKIQNQELKKPIAELENVRDKCPVCKSSIDPNKRNELINDYFSQIKLNETSINQLNKELRDLKSQKTVLDEHKSIIQSINIELLMEQLKNLEEGRKELISVKGKIRDLNGKVSILDQIDRQLNEKKNALKELKPKYEKYLVAEGSLNSLGDPGEQIMELKRVKGDENDLKEQISGLIEVTGGSIENLQGEIKYLEDLSRRYQQLSGAVDQKESFIIRIKEVNENLEEVQEQLQKLNQEIDDIAYDEKIHLKTKIDLESKNHEFSDLNGKKRELIGKESGLNTYIGELETKLDSYHTYQNEIKNIKDFLKLLNHIRDIYGKDGVQKDLRNISRPMIEKNTREFFEKFNFEYSDIKLDEDYDITVYGPAGENNLDMISGGEKIAVALALRLGITQTLSGGNLELIMLDEPTIHLDAYRRQELIELLKRMSIIPQMIIVTHDPDLEEAADHILRVTKEEGRSMISDF
jgi:exonuclease SbcC